jgi:manganese/zinc/iron transport system substrate-binding protein
MKKFNKRIVIIVSTLTIIAIILAGCKRKMEDSNASDEKLTIVTTTGILADAVKNIVGEKANVVSLMGPGVDPHLFKATQGDLGKLTKASIVFYNGLHLEGKMSDVLKKLSQTKTVVAVAEKIDSSRLRIAADRIYDPHIWFDVKLWKECVTTIANTLVEKDSMNADWYKLNAATYILALDSLDKNVLASIEQLPPNQRVLITAHDAFGYFGNAYGIEVRGLQGISTVSEFGLRDVTNLVDFILSRKIKAIFIETSISEKSINAVIEGCKNKGWNVRIGGSLYSDALGAEGTEAGTYIGMVNSNVTTLVEALK